MEYEDPHPIDLLCLIRQAHEDKSTTDIDLSCQKLASMVKGKIVTEINAMFYRGVLTNDEPSKRVLPISQVRIRFRDKEALIKSWNFFHVQRSPLVAQGLSYICNRRWRTLADMCIFQFFHAKSDHDMDTAMAALAFRFEDQVLADCLKHDHVVRLFNILEQKISQQEMQSTALQVLSCVNFTAHEKAMEADRIQLLVKVINGEDFGTHDYQMTLLAVLTLANIAKALPKFVVEILQTDVLERLQWVIVVHGSGAMVDNIALFLVAVCRTDLSRLNKEVLALSTLQLLEASPNSEHHIEQACNAFQYLTYAMQLQIEELAFKMLIEKLIMIIHKPPRRNCLFPGYALGVLGNIAIWGSSDQIEILTSNSKFLESLKIMMAGPKKIQKEACQIISNIAARMNGLIEEMYEAGLIEALCILLEKDKAPEEDEFYLKMEATWAIYHGIYGSLLTPKSERERE